MITLVNDHGRFEVDPAVLQRAVDQLGHASVDYVRHKAAAHCGHDLDFFGLYSTALDDCNLIECLIIWVESGNHLWHEGNQR